MAKRIQQAALPKVVPGLKGWEIAYYYRPAHEVGGDFYNFHPLSKSRLRLAVRMQQARGCPQRPDIWWVLVWGLSGVVGPLFRTRP